MTTMEETITDAHMPAEMALRAEASAIRKSNRDFVSAFFLAVQAGSFIAFGAALFTHAIHDSTLGVGLTKLIGGMTFSLGLILVIIAGADLFTGDTLMVMGCFSRKIKVRHMLRSWGFVFLGNLVGSVVAVGAAAWLARSPGWMIIGNAFFAGLLTWLYALSPSVAWAMAVAFVFGPPFALRDIAQDTLLQATVDENMLGRIYASREMMRSISFIVAGLFFAWLSDHIPVRAVYGIGGALYVVTALYALQNRSIRLSTITAESYTSEGLHQ